MAQPIFRAGEVLDMAIEVEQDGIMFYEAFRQRSQDPRATDVFDYLIDQERKHMATFSQIKSELAEDYPLPESYPGEMRRYMDCFVKDRIFQDPGKAAEQEETLSDPFRAIETALDFEQRSIVFYSKIKSIVRPSEGGAIDRVIAQEHTHIEKLLDLRENLDRRPQ